MSIVITTPTGNIGRALTEHLLDAGASIKLLVRDAQRVEAFRARGAQVCVGSLDDADFVVEATADARQLFWLTPLDLAAADLRARQAEFGEVAAHAVTTNGIERVVHLSSVGAHEAEGNGPIGGLHHNELLLDRAASNLLHLRAAYFMENLLALAPLISAQKMILQPMSAETRMPMVATRDIAAVAAEELLDESWSGRRIRGVHGPADLSWKEVAATISKVLGTDVTYSQVPGEAVEQALQQMGLSLDTAHTFVEMLEGLGSGRIHAAEARTAETTTPTTLESFVSDSLYPAIAAMGAK